MKNIKGKKKILFIGNSFSDMIKCRGHVMSCLASAGYPVCLFAPFERQHPTLPQFIHWKHWFCKSKNHNPFIEVLSFLHLFWLLITLRPDIVFSYTAKPNLYITLFRILFRYKNCCIITGLGRVFTIRVPFYQFMKKLLTLSFKLASQVWVMNQFDYRYFKFTKVNSYLSYMPGEGVDIERFAPKEPLDSKDNSPVKLLFIGRLLKSKGLEELFEAVKNLSLKGNKILLTVIGPYDVHDPDKINKEQFDSLVNQELIKYGGVVEDVRELIQQSDCLILPSYREGLPRVLLEASSMECPVITTKVPGCQDVVIEGFNGFLVPARCSKSLEDAIGKFMSLPEKKRQELGREGRKLIQNRFTTVHVQSIYLEALKTLTKG